MSYRKVSDRKIEVVKVGELELGKPCPPLKMKPEPTCDIMNLTYRFNVVGEEETTTPRRLAAAYYTGLVELALHYEVERCSLEYTLGDLLYSTTLLPGERVWISFRNRHSVSRLTEDTKFSASTHARSSESLWMDTFRNLATDIDWAVSDRTRASSHSEFETKASGGYWTIGITGGGDVKVRGKFDSQSALDFSSEMQRHLRSSFHQTNEISRTAESTSITEINSHRTVEQEVKDELKAGVRVFQNMNQCHTLTFLFYQIARRQRIRIRLTGASYRALNPDAETAVRRKAYVLSLSDNQEVLKVSERAELAEKGYGFATFVRPPVTSVGTSSIVGTYASLPKLASKSKLYTDAETLRAIPRLEMAIPMTERVRAVDQIKRVLPESKFEFEFVRETLLPTNAVFVDAALGACVACEPYVLEKQKLELELLKLENQRLKREIELLDKHQLYRCCPAGEGE